MNATSNDFDFKSFFVKSNDKNLTIYAIYASKVYENNIDECYDLRKKIVGVLGLSFKAENDDIRDSLSIKLLKYLKSKKIRTLQSDEYYKDKNNIDKKLLVKKSDIIIISTPHRVYKNLKINKKKVLIDIWGFRWKKIEKLF